MDFKLPDIGEGIAEGEIIKWFVKEGDKVEEDQEFLEVMTDKATAEIPCPKSGYIQKLLVKEGDIIDVGSVIAIINDQLSENESEDNDQKVNFTIPKPESNFEIKPEIKTNKKVLATPATRKFCRENNVDISQVNPTGNNGKVTKEDVVKYLNSNKTKVIEPDVMSRDMIISNKITSSNKSYEYSSSNDEERIPFRGLRKKIAENLLNSTRNVPHFMIADEVDMTNLVNFRNEVKEHSLKKGVKLTYLPFIIKAVCIALKEFPAINSTLDEEASELILKKDYNIGVAVATTQGLIVPVLKNAETRTILNIAEEVQNLANKTREGKVSVDNLKGGTFTITNIGSIGGLFSSPIINHPEVAILGINKIVKKPVVVGNDEIKIRSMMYLSMSCDHRVVDGATAAQFLNRLIELLQNPKLLLLE